MKYQSVAILGAGAVGSYVMWGLAKKKEIDLCVVASGERKARYERDGFVINGQVYMVNKARLIEKIAALVREKSSRIARAVRP